MRHINMYMPHLIIYMYICLISSDHHIHVYMPHII